MANYLFKKSYQHKNFKEIPYKNLWNTKGVFTTIRVRGHLPKFILLSEHLKNLNQSLKKFNINFSINSKIFSDITEKKFKKNIKYDHLLRVAVNKDTVSIDLRERLKQNKFFKGILIKYKRPQAKIKNLYYKKILQFLDSINTNSSEVILLDKDNIMEGCTTNIICVKNKKLYIPKGNYYFGTTLKFFIKNIDKSVVKTNISLSKLKTFDEILLVGSGKGIVAINNIPQINWINNSQDIYKELEELYKKYLGR